MFRLFKDPKRVKELKLYRNLLLPFRCTYIMWCGLIIYKKKDQWKLDRSIKNGNFLIIKNHEKIHLKQAQYLGSWFKFYIKYVWEWIKGGAFLTESSYYMNPFEVEAYANENNLNYTKNYDLSNLKNKYTLKNRRFLFKLHKKDWKTWIKSI